MSEKQLKGLSCFEWASVAQYLVYVESVAGLHPVSDAQIYSFPYGRMGAERLIAQKRRVKHVIEANLSRLERFVGKFVDDLTDEEKVALRSFYRSIKASLEVVDGQLKTAKELKVLNQLSIVSETEGSEDVLPF